MNLNDSKTEITLIGNPQQTSKIKHIYLKVGSELIAPSSQIRNLGIYFDNNYTFKPQIDTVCKKSFMHLKKSDN